jgi:hypothetical protein
MNTFYVYAYIRNKDSCTARSGTPYYIGKGKGDRLYAPHTGSIPCNKSHIVILEDSLTEIGAFALERRYIRWWGRKNLGTGILNNMTDGSEGTDGAVFGPRSAEIRKKISMGNLGKKLSTDTRKKISDSAKGRKLPPVSDETRRKMSKSQSGKIKITNSLNGKTFEEIYGTSADLQKEKRSKSMVGKVRGPMSEEHKEKIRKANSNRKIYIVECPYCYKSGDNVIMQRWHFDNCRENINE